MLCKQWRKWQRGIRCVLQQFKNFADVNPQTHRTVWRDNTRGVVLELTRTIQDHVRRQNCTLTGSHVKSLRRRPEAAAPCKSFS